MFWNKCDLKGDAKLVQDIFDLILLALDWASILHQLLQDHEYAFVDLVIFRNDFLEIWILLLHHSEKFCQMFVMHLIIALLDGAAVENDAFCDVEIVLWFFRVVHLEAKPEELKVESS